MKRSASGLPPSPSSQKVFRTDHYETHQIDESIFAIPATPSTPFQLALLAECERVERAPISKTSEDTSCVTQPLITPTKPNHPRDNLDLSFYDIPLAICERYGHIGVSRLFPWQAACLSATQGEPSALSPLEGGNLVYIAPTSGGKTMVAEVLLLRSILATRKRALFVVPYISLALEKAHHLQTVLSAVGLEAKSVCANTGAGVNFCSPDCNVSIAVCTIEKANSIVNAMLTEGVVDQLCCVVVDEAHLVSERERGYLIELLISKLRFSSPTTQLICLSATLSNVELVAKWMNAKYFKCDIRPVPLTECVLDSDGRMYDKTLTEIRRFDSDTELDHLAQLCAEVVESHHGVLVFCASKKDCEKNAIALSEHARFHATVPEAAGVLAQLRATFGGVDPVLAATVPRGIGYHHAGLTMEERTVIESAYRTGAIQVLFATSTLAAGVNLPAKRVILRSPKVGCSLVDVVQYRQMIGRAGRVGKYTSGEAIVMCSLKELGYVHGLMGSPLPELKSCLPCDQGGLQRLILEAFTLGLASTLNDLLNLFLPFTLFSLCNTPADVCSAVQKAGRYLVENAFVGWYKPEQTFPTTHLGRATVASGFSPSDGLLVKTELSKARKCFLLETELHLVYQVTPIFGLMEPPWRTYHSAIMQKLGPGEWEVASAVGVSETYLKMAARHAPARQDPAQQENLDMLPGIHRRFYTAVILHRLLTTEQPVSVIAKEYGVPRGSVQAMQAAAATFASMVHVFCEKLNWHPIALLVEHLIDRLAYGVRPELLPLMSIDGVRNFRARVLFDAGFTTVELIAKAKSKEIAMVLHDGLLPFGDVMDVDEDLQTAQGIISAAAVALAQQMSELRRTVDHLALYSSPSQFRAVLPTSSVKRARTAHQAQSDSPALPPPPARAPKYRPPTPIPIHMELADKENYSASGETTPVISSKQVQRAQSTPESEADQHRQPLHPPLQHAVQAAALSPATSKSPPKTPVPLDSDAAMKVVLGAVSRASLRLAKRPARPQGFMRASNFTPSQQTLTQLEREKVERPEHEPVEPTLPEVSYDMHSAALPSKQLESYSSFTDAAVWSEFISHWAQAKQFAFSIVKADAQANDVSHLPRLLVLGVCWDVERSSAVNLQGLQEQRLCDLKSMLASQKPKIAFAIASWVALLIRSGWSVAGELHDPLVAKWMLAPDDKKTAVVPIRKTGDSFVCAASTAADALASHVSLQPQLKKQQLFSGYQESEMPLARVLANMESAGIGMSDNIDDPKRCIEHRMAAISAELNRMRLPGRGLLELTKPACVAEFLYDELKLLVPAPKPERQKRLGSKKPKKPMRSTNAEVLEAMATMNPNCKAPRMIMEYRSLSHALSDLLSLNRFADRCSETQMRRVRAQFSQLTGTGRLAVSNPNLQALPHRIDFADNSGSVNVRQTVIARAKCVLVSADYSQLEIRVMAHLSGDRCLIASLESGGDVFRQIAANWLHKAESDVTSTERDQAKRMCYGMLYGKGAAALAADMGVSEGAASQFMMDFMKRFPDVEAFIQSTRDRCRRDSFVTTILERRRFLPNINAKTSADCHGAERQAINTVCQGSAADLVKLAMIHIDKRLEEQRHAGRYMRLVLQIHDELLFECDERYQDVLHDLINRYMTRAINLKVKLPVSLHVGRSWGTMEPVASRV